MPVGSCILRKIIPGTIIARSWQLLFHQPTEDNTMKVIKKALLSLACVMAVGTSVPANALVITDMLEANPDIFITKGLSMQSYTYVHNLIDDGFVPGIDHIGSAMLSIRLTDTTSNEDSFITVGLGQIEIGGNVDNNSQNLPSPAGTFVNFALSAVSLADLMLDGMLSVTVSSTNRSFYFADSTLTASVVDRPASVPEPLTMALMGIGLLGIGASRRKAEKK